MSVARASAQDLESLHQDLDQLAQEVESQVIAWRRDFHQHPELSNREFRTAKIITEHLSRLGMKVQTGVAHTGVVGILRGKADSPVVALRADMDALPVTEETGLPFASKARTIYNGKEVGVMHACGHDNHIAILMGVAQVLAQIRGDLPGTVKLIFQPSEEGPPIGEEGGARLMIKQGVLENPAPSAIFGLHVVPDPWQMIGFRPGGLMASADDLQITIRGSQTHGGKPWGGIDPIVVAAQVVVGLQSIISRQMPLTTAPGVVSIGSIHGGVRSNIIPDEVEMLGTIRALDPEMRQDIVQRIERTATKIAESAGATAEVSIPDGVPVTYNDPELTAQMSPTLQRIAGKGKIDANRSATMIAEDFSEYQEKIPGLFFLLGVAPKDTDPKTVPSNHSPLFDVDESALIVGVRALSNLAVDYLFMQSEYSNQGMSATETAPALPGKEPADTVYCNGKIYSMTSPGSPLAQEALAVKGERVLFVGDKEEATHYIDAQTKIIDLQGNSVYPGFTDAHIHPLMGGLISFMCDLAAAKDVPEVLQMLKVYANEHPDRAWVRAANLQPAAIIGHAPPVNLLDGIVPDRPVYVEGATGHSAWANSKALELASISSKTTDPKDGALGRIPGSDDPSGVLLEPPAMDMVRSMIPPYSRAENVNALKSSMEMLNSFGVTNLIEARTEQHDIDAFLDLASRGGLTAHVRFSLYADITKGEQVIADTFALKRRLESGALLMPDITFNQVKLFIDGTVEEQTAAMQWNYTGQDHRGSPWADAKTLKRVIAAFDQAGLQIHVHAIGDLGTKMVLDAFEYARRQNGIRDSRHHIAHLHVVEPNDIGRFDRLGVTANFQSLWASGDDDYVKKINPTLLADERLHWQYPIGAVVRSGASVVFGSDWPVTTANPVPAMQVAVTRRGPDTVVKDAWMPEQLIDVSTVVDGYTRKGAWLSFREKEIGTLEKGKLADLVILNGDLFSESRFELIKNEVQTTVFRGKVVYTKHQ